MNTTPSNKPPIWFWIISVIALIWNLMGVNAYLQQAFDTDSFRAMYSEEQLNMVANTPAWVTAAFAIAVFSGALAGIALLIRKKWATTLWLISLVAVIFQMGYVLTNGYESSMVMTIMIIVFAILFLLFSRHANAKGWLS
ncbi:hypothetical protein [Changchengzhania lutea]|uniref:hypothetical protein n=1 Tax=Changchengzhania lutea TaxID=2049305 RepID=UPI00115E5403|nr:hypothetical protein [Changchengzhania lutea]